MQTTTVRSIGSALLLAALFTSCGHTDTDPFAASGFNAFDDNIGARVEEYHQTTFPGNGAKTGKPSLYIDFSSGIYDALSQPANKAVLDAVYSDLAGGIDVFKLSNNTIVPFAENNLNFIGAQVMDKNNYKEVYAPITSAVKEIVSKNNDAVLVSDFEEYDNKVEITNVPYLKQLFAEWLAKGNTIHFFISDYMENKLPKHLFFAVFNYGNVTEESVISRIGKAVGNLSRFDLSNKPFVFTQAYPSEKSGGIFYDSAGKNEKAINVLDLKQNKYINGFKRSHSSFEFYPFGLDWETIAKLRQEYQKMGQFNSLFRNLFVDISNENSYHVDGFSVKVSDVTSDFEQFAKCREAVKHQPKIVKGSNGENKIPDTEKDPIALNCYNSDGKVRDQWVYRPQTFNVIPELFAINKALLDNTMRDSQRKKVELAVDFDSRFDVKSIPSTARLLRVDIVVDNVSQTTAASGEKFSWQSSKKGVANTALLNSVTTALNEPRVKPDHHVVYSYYITTLAN